MKKIFFITGLGADSTAFNNIGDLPYPRVMVDWISNEENETYTDYCKRLIKTYNIDKNAILVGLSFGGLTAQKIATLLEIEQVILISSFRSNDDFKPLVKNVFNTNAYKLIPEFQIPLVDTSVANFLNSTNSFINNVLSEMISRADRKIMSWSLEIISQNKEEIGTSITKHNIIGSSDRILIPWENDNTHLVKGGSHFMVYTKGKQVTQILKSIIDEAF